MKTMLINEVEKMNFKTILSSDKKLPKDIDRHYKFNTLQWELLEQLSEDLGISKNTVICRALYLLALQMNFVMHDDTSKLESVMNLKKHLLDAKDPFNDKI